MTLKIRKGEPMSSAEITTETSDAEIKRTCHALTIKGGKEIRMNLDEYQAKALRAFWHKSRRVFVPCTALDIAARSGFKSADRAGSTATELTRAGLLKARSDNGRHFYELTESGRGVLNEVLSLIFTTRRLPDALPASTGKNLGVSEYHNGSAA